MKRVYILLAAWFSRPAAATATRHRRPTTTGRNSSPPCCRQRSAADSERAKPPQRHGHHRLQSDERRAGAITAATVDFRVDLTGFPATTTITLAHIHTGAAGVSGGVLVNAAVSAGRSHVDERRWDIRQTELAY